MDSKKRWWKCEKGHEWQATVANRNAGRGCPFCAGKRPILGETDLASLFPELIEDWDLEKNGRLVPHNVTAGSQRKVWWKCEKGHEWQATIVNRTRGSGCPYCAGRIVCTGLNDLATVKPQLASEWNYEKNVELNPQDTFPNSNKKVWWICEKGHEWEARIADRTKGSSCPYCVGKRVIEGETDLATTHPKLALEWHPYKNDAISPKDVTANSRRTAWWKCKEGHEWEASSLSRTRGRGCPYCSGMLDKRNIDER